MPTTGLFESDGAGRSLIDRVTERKYPAVGSDEVIPAAVRRGGDSDDRIIGIEIRLPKFWASPQATTKPSLLATQYPSSSLVAARPMTVPA